MSYEKERAIAAQNAATAAATLLAGTGVSMDVYEQVRESIYRGTLSLAGIAPVDAPSVAETVAQIQSTFPGAQVSGQPPVQQTAPQVYSPPPSSSNGPGSVEVRGGKHAGKTIADIFEQDSSYVEWMASPKNNNNFTRVKAQEFLASLAPAT